MKFLKAWPSSLISTTIGLELATKRVFQALTETDQKGRSVRRPQRFYDLLRYVRPDDVSETAAKRQLRVWLSIALRAMTAVFCASSHLQIQMGVQLDADSISSIIDNSIIDIGHEALIRRWDKLEGKGKENWIREEEQDAEEYRGLLRYAERWLHHTPRRSDEMEEWWSNRKPNSFWAERYTRHNAADFEKIRDHLARSRVKAKADVRSTAEE